MMKKILFIILLMNALMLNAQVKDTISANDEEKTTNIKASLEYMDKPVFSGRNYMEKGPLLSPELSLNFKAGISLAFTSYLLPNDTSNTRQSVFGISYTNDIYEWWNIDGGVSLYHTVVNKAATKKSTAKTQVQNDFGISLSNTFDFNWMYLQNSIYYFFGTQKGWDVMLVAGKDVALDNLTGIEDLSISPNFTFEMGNHFAKFRQLKKAILNQTDVTTSTKFQPLNYEITLPIEYEYYAFTFNITPAYAFPVNVLPSESNLGSNFFFISAKITYQLDFKTKK